MKSDSHQHSATPHNVEDSRLNKPKAYYGEYIHLEKILTAQVPLSATPEKPTGEHDEMLFIIMHQTIELWFKQILHEMKDVIRIMSAPFIPSTQATRCLHHLTRVCEILKLCVQQWDVLDTMSPTDFMAFRDNLYPASGFQSFQFRLLENALGVDPARRLLHHNLAYHAHLKPEHQEQVLKSEKEVSLFAAVQSWLERTPFVKVANFDFLTEYRSAVQRMYDTDALVLQQSWDVSTDQGRKELADALQKNADNKQMFLSMFDEDRHKELQDKGLVSLSFKATQAALLITLYSDQPVLHVPYMILQRLITIDQLMATFRFRHMMTVTRTIGSKLGTGGSSGYAYLKAGIEPARTFRDLTNVATYIIRPSAVPQLPKEVVRLFDLVSEVEPIKKTE